MKEFNNILVIVFGFALVLLIAITISHCCSSTPVEENVIDINTEEIQTIQKRNDSLVIDIKKLDSVKDAEIIQIQSIDNDSVVSLFYKLISE